MLSFTLDTNCVVAVEESQSEADAIRRLVAAHERGDVDVAVVAMMASEKQRSGRIDNFGQFRERLQSLGMGTLSICMPLAYFNITFFDACLWAGPDQVALELSIHQILFPEIEFELDNHCRRAIHVGGEAAKVSAVRKWMNAKCDVQALWSHVNSGRDIFVTNDGNFHKKTKLPRLVALGAGRIERPETALSHLSGPRL